MRTRHGLTLAAAGVDASNVAGDDVVLLPLDPDASASLLRAQVHARTGRNVGVVVTDTAGRAWRQGQTDIAIGAAGLVVLEDHAGRLDPHGNELAVTAPAVADEIAAAVELTGTKLSARPVAVVRGRADLVLPIGEDGLGARALVRPEGGDLFGWGSREAVVRAVRAEAGDAGPFGEPASADDLADALVRALGPHGVQVSAGPTERPSLDVGHLDERWAGALLALAFAHGWVSEPRRQHGGHRLRPRASSPAETP